MQLTYPLDEGENCACYVAQGGKICINMTLQPYHTKIKTSGRAAQELKYDTRGNIVGVVDGNQNHTQYRMDE